MAARESALRQRIGAVLRAHGWFVQPIESETAPGIPDLWCIKEGIGVWVELKHAKVLPKRESTPVFGSLNHNLSNEQVNWIDLCVRHGGRACVLAAYNRTIWLVPGELADQFNEMTFSELEDYKVKKEELHELLFKM